VLPVCGVPFRKYLRLIHVAEYFVLLSLFLARVSNVVYATYPWFYTWKTVEDTAMKFLSSGVSYSSIKFQFENSKEEHREVTTRSTNPLTE
jgi:hypothetical protein